MREDTFIVRSGAEAVNVPHLTIVFVPWIATASSASFATSGRRSFARNPHAEERRRGAGWASPRTVR